MNRSAVLGVLALLVAVVLVFALVDFGGAPGPIGTGADQRSGDVASQSAGAVDAAEPADGDVARQMDADAMADNVEFDPLIEGAKSGFRGRVVTSGGSPVADCGVRIYRLGVEGILPAGGGDLMAAVADDFEPDFVGGETMTASDGRFLMDGVWPHGAYILLAGIGTDSPTHRIVSRTPGPGQIVDLGDVVLEDAGVFIGRVVDQSGEPVPGAKVWAADIPGQISGFVPLHTFDPEGFVIVAEQAPFEVLELPSWVERVVDDFPVPQTVTAADGTFKLTGVKPGSNMLAINKRGLLPLLRSSERATAGEVKDLGTLELRDGEEVVGTVVDSEGKPVAGAEVIGGARISLAPVPVAYAVALGTTEADGSFHALGFPAGDVLVAARRSRGHSWVLAPSVHVNQDVEVVLPVETSLVVRAVGDGGEPVDQPRLKVVPGQKGQGSAEMMVLGFVQPIDLSGRVEAGDDGAQVVTGLNPGKYMVLADAPGYAVSGANVDLTRDAKAEVTLQLDRVKEHAVRVVTTDGKPVRNATIYASARGDRVSDLPVDCGRTSREGTKTIDKVQTDEIRVTASHPAYGMVHGRHQLGEPPLELTFATPGAIEGLMLDDGAPPVVGKWSIIAIRRGAERGAVEGAPPMAAPDATGQFAFRGLQPGNYRLQVVDFLDSITSPGSMISTLMSAEMRRGGRSDSKDVEVLAGQTVRADFDTAGQEYTGPGAQITGTVLINGQPGTGISVQSWTGERMLYAEVTEYGTFDLGRVPVGEHRLAIQQVESDNWFSGGRPSLIHSQKLEVEDGAHQDLVIRVDTGSVQGLVRSPDGSPLGGAVIASLNRRMSDGNEVRMSSEVDGRGRFTFDGVPVGEDYRLDIRVMGDRPMRQNVDGIDVAPSQVTNLEVLLERTHSISGRVDLATIGGGENRGRWLQFEPVDEGLRGSTGARVDEEGNFTTRDGLLPGSYRARLRTFGDGGIRSYVQDLPIVVGRRDVEDVVISLRPEEPDPPSEAGGR